MTDTTTPAELAVPDLAIARWNKPHPVLLTDTEFVDRIRDVAAPIVAAELRRHADLLVARAHGHLSRDARLADAALLRARADELDPQP